MGEGGDLLEPLWGLLVVALVELTQLPGVGHPADPVTYDEQTHDGQADLGLAHLRKCDFLFNFLLSISGLGSTSNVKIGP